MRPGPKRKNSFRSLTILFLLYESRFVIHQFLNLFQI
nr:MAG TPA: hypothetical protein [Bacteriophage sp.]